MTATAPHTAPTHDCADDYCVGRDSQGNLRMRGGHGQLIANHDHTIDDVREWFERSKPGAFRENYRAVLRFLRRELGAPDARPVHRDEPQPPVVVDVDTTYESNGYAESAKHFVNDIRTYTPPADDTLGRRTIRAHQMHVLHDDGIYRHLRFRSPDTGIAWFDLVTWPGALNISGDMGSWTFRRLEDMFDFFGGKPDINPHYWQEKIDGEPDTAKAYDVELAKQMIREHSAEWEPLRTDALGRPVKTIHSPLLGDVPDDDESDDAAADLKAEVDALIEELVDDESHDRMLIDNFRAHGHEFVDTWEWELRGYTHRYLWCCHAIRWGIREYRTHKAAASA